MFRSRRTVKEFVALMSIPFMFSIFVIYSYHTPPETEIYMYLKRHSATRKHLKPTRISSSGKIELLLFVGMHSAPSRLDRRNSVRETWMKECQSNPNAVSSPTDKIQMEKYCKERKELNWKTRDVFMKIFS